MRDLRLEDRFTDGRLLRKEVQRAAGAKPGAGPLAALGRRERAPDKRRCHSPMIPLSGSLFTICVGRPLQQSYSMLL